MNSKNAGKQRKIIHIDMDCFYAAIEIRDNPLLQNKPVAVGGTAEQRGVITTCNYIARKFGVRSAMATVKAYQYCKDLILLPVNMPKYRDVAKNILDIFYQYTDLVEPIALDEAFLDVSDVEICKGSASLIAQEIRNEILQKENLTASAGVAANKFLAKIASGWKKPNGFFVIRPQDIDQFIETLPIIEIHGVGRVMAEKLTRLGLRTCADLQKMSLFELTDKFGKLGQRLYDYCRGIDQREVEPNRLRKSLSVETTFSQDIQQLEHCIEVIKELYIKLNKRLKDYANDRQIKNQYIKIKFNDFKIITSEIMSNSAELEHFIALFQQLYQREKKPIRLIGLGVHFSEAVPSQQQSLFF